MNYEKKAVHISAIKNGDTIIHNGELKTVCTQDIRKSTFLGTTIFGDSYHLGQMPVIKIIFNKKTGTFTAYQNDEYIFVTPKKTGFLMGHFLSLKECIEKITCTQLN